LFLVPVSAGFPSPADDYLEDKLDLNQHLIKHEAATFFVKVRGDSMIGAGIHSGDLLIVDRALEPTDNSVVIAVVNSELTVKRMFKRQGHLMLVPDNGNYQPLPITECMDFEIWGVVTHVIHAV
jgi:DNA polymerase V